MAQAQGLAERYRAQVERSAYTTLAMLVRPLGYPEIEVRFAQNQELSTDVGAPFGPEGRPVAPLPSADAASPVAGFDGRVEPAAVPISPRAERPASPPH
jgi:hypothetical protein